MDYTSTLETLEGLSNDLARHCAHHIAAWEILYGLGKVMGVPEIAHGSEQGALFTLLCFLSMLYRWITRVLWRPLKVSG